MKTVLDPRAKAFIDLCGKTLTGLRDKAVREVRGHRTLASVTAVACAGIIGGSVIGVVPVSQQAANAAGVPANEQVLLSGTTSGSYFWDDGSGQQGDTGVPAIGKPMQQGLFASPSWPLGTEGYIRYNGKTAKFFIGDRGPGTPSDDGVMLDIDGKTYADLVGATWDSQTLTVGSDQGHIQVDYIVTKWGDGPGKRGTPVPFSSGAWGSS
ncbi:hypothetical protein Pth03_40460 [Planotetraspora thailandica]|uniref:Uncharacterized protein n=1 Tax=Planotetraspora thailandica TaxID=487172 RepID=A0A8J3XUQ0_9ACTN|nr:hypothetical protein [Planotetraspora thailandica]GII55657.1 hypothetical protein Pth03_40460 [Planotetraspora thailandica]